MSGALNRREFALEVLKKAQKPLAQKEIWEEGIKCGLQSTLKGKTPWATIGAMIYEDIRDNPSSLFMFASKKPTTFWLKERENELGGGGIITRKLHTK